MPQVPEKGTASRVKAATNVRGAKSRQASKPDLYLYEFNIQWQCQETLPECENCIRSSLTCRYFSHAANIAAEPQQSFTLHETQIFSLTDMRLFHHYLVAAYPHFPVRNDNIWLVYITPIAHQCSYLMHALLSLSASHLTKLTKSSFTAAAQTHRLSAITGLNNVLNEPVTSAEQGDAILATCYALLMQSWYMDDGLPTFLVLTRSCDAITRHVQSLKVGSIFAHENLESRVESMQTRLIGAPAFSTECLRSAISSLNGLLPLCRQAFEKKLWATLEDCFISLAHSPLKAYKTHLQIERSLIALDPNELEQLLDPTNTASQLLLAHIVALNLIMRPIACNERKNYTVTMYGIRMTTWIGRIFSQLSQELRQEFSWLLRVSELHVQKRLEEYTLASKSRGSVAIRYVRLKQCFPVFPFKSNPLTFQTVHQHTMPPHFPFNTHNTPSPAPRPDTSTLRLTAAPSTDIWRNPSQNRFSAPIIYKSLSLSAFLRSRVRVTVSASAAWSRPYDQGGLLFYRPDTQQWVKSGLELYEGQLYVITVAADKGADMSLVLLPAGNEATVEMQAVEGALWVFVVDGERRVPIREVTWALGGAGG
ncbi:Uncharacterized protein LSUE1_G007758 [Lachnellula suecica]|uniref:Zn(2)-C6 fungal-type domain-containing protein n=1 Tax=Lachnellula suecica TaxID=602035 RepID=A0A8T9BSS5_9HELO|nr:Uncharacterized protein LSUE1_G007758 [Lachnellula suecica]